MVDDGVGGVFMDVRVTSYCGVGVQSMKDDAIPPFPTYRSKLGPKDVFRCILFNRSVERHVLGRLTVFYAGSGVTPERVALSANLYCVINFFRCFSAPVAIFSGFGECFKGCEGRAVTTVAFRGGDQVVN